jgi:alpha,alpha-trehalase
MIRKFHSRRNGLATPLDLYGPLFEAVQAKCLYPDSKTFADAVPKRAPAAILADYCAGDFTDAEVLRAFVEANFAIPEMEVTAPASSARPPIAEHIRELWPMLTRPAFDPPPGSSALAMPAPYVVPGGRFSEMYYWDSYFTMLGLKADGREDLVESMLVDFVSLVERYGHVPNGTRSYYLSRSQPPFLFLMMGLSEAKDQVLLARRLAVLRREHDFWMGEGRLVRMPDGSSLNRYLGGSDRPREESWREDVELALESGRAAAPLFNDIRAAAESGWDFSSRWLADGQTLASIDTTNIVPVDLNSLLYGLETAIHDHCSAVGDKDCATEFAALAASRRDAIERWLWSDRESRYGDWDIAGGRLRPGLSAVTAYPLFLCVASRKRALLVAGTISEHLLAPGGMRTTLVHTGQQWDAPNGWAPLQWIASGGLWRYGERRLAREISNRFLATVAREYRASGKLLEKYDVEEQAPGGGGEYPTQDGFGWTNGVVRALMQRYRLERLP